MPIVSTRLTQFSKNRTGEFRYAGLILTDQDGVDYPSSTKVMVVGGETEEEAIIAFKAKQTIKFNRSIARREVLDAIYKFDWDYTLKHATLTDLRDAVREEYRVKEKAELLPLARRIIEWLENGRFTVTQLRNTFEMTDPEFTAFRTRLEALRDADAVVEAAEGE